MLTDRLIRTAKIQPSLNQRELRDQKVQGLVLRVYKTGKRVWFVFYRRKEDNRRRYLKLGAYPGLSLKQARELAEIELGRIAVGEDPQAEREAAREQSGPRRSLSSAPATWSSTPRSTSAPAATRWTGGGSTPTWPPAGSIGRSTG